MRDIGFNVLNKNNGILKWEPSVLVRKSLLDEDHTELNIRHITWSIFYFGCQVCGVGNVNMPIQKVDSVVACCSKQ